MTKIPAASCVYATYFDDYMGHCWHKYYYYADESGLKEYGAIPITQEERHYRRQHEGGRP